MHQAGNQPRLYYDARAINHQDKFLDHKSSQTRNYYTATSGVLWNIMLTNYICYSS